MLLVGGLVFVELLAFVEELELLELLAFVEELELLVLLATETGISMVTLSKHGAIYIKNGLIVNTESKQICVALLVAIKS